MKKPTKKTAMPDFKKQIASFPPGTIVREPSLVTDAYGVSWWVDPFSKTIEKANVDH